MIEAAGPIQAAGNAVADLERCWLTKPMIDLAVPLEDFRKGNVIDRAQVTGLSAAGWEKQTVVEDQTMILCDGHNLAGTCLQVRVYLI
jgi:hypothetical protein